MLVVMLRSITPIDGRRPSGGNDTHRSWGTSMNRSYSREKTRGNGWPAERNLNIDCSELVEGTTLFLPISVDGALLSAGDGHARQGDGEVSQLAIEAPMERARLTVSLADFELENPIARIDAAWLTFGFDEDLDEAAAQAVDGMLALMDRELGLERRDALALASVVVDLRVTQLVNGVQGIHAVLRDDAIRSE